jgi:membrane-associated phospholipid phosphatase
LRPEEALLIVYGAALTALMAATGEWHFSAFHHAHFLQCFAALAALVFVRKYVRSRRDGKGERALRSAAGPALGVLRDFFPFFVGLLFYETLHDLTPVIRPSVVDARLVAIDRAVFGVDVAWWMGRFASPLVTRVMLYCYLSYFFAPGLLASIIYWRDQRALFRDLMVSLCVVTLLGYAGYLVVPAVGPYVFQASLFPERLPGGGADTHFFIAQLDSLKGVARDCFPSMHTAHTTVVLAFAWRFSRRIFYFYLPIAIGLYLSTIYLRMHYVVDVAAGFAVSAAAVAIGPRLERWWKRAPQAAAITVPAEPAR